MGDVVFCKSFCPDCSAVNYVRLGPVAGGAYLDLEGVRCRACGREFLLREPSGADPAFLDGDADC